MAISWPVIAPGAQLVGQHLEPHEALDARHQLHVVDGLGEEIVGAGLQAPHPVRRLIERGDHEDGNVRVF
jgi:hypothetical protein